MALRREAIAIDKSIILGEDENARARIARLCVG
jgi:hypothetical protein